MRLREQISQSMRFHDALVNSRKPNPLRMETGKCPSVFRRGNRRILLGTRCSSNDRQMSPAGSNSHLLRTIDCTGHPPTAVGRRNVLSGSEGGNGWRNGIAGNKNLTLWRLYEDSGELGESILTHWNRRERICDGEKNGYAWCYGLFFFRRVVDGISRFGRERGSCNWSLLVRSWSKDDDQFRTSATFKLGSDRSAQCQVNVKY